MPDDGHSVCRNTASSVPQPKAPLLKHQALRQCRAVFRVKGRSQEREGRELSMPRLKEILLAPFLHQNRRAATLNPEL